MSSYGQTKHRTKLKPVLRKLTQSEKNSLDLDRPAAEQDGLGIGMGIYNSGTGFGSRSSHDISFSQTGRRGYHHRSTSGTSQFSTATTGSGHRTGSFVHPFQQTPRPYTPPLNLTASSYQNSLRESEFGHDITPTEDDDQLRRLDVRSTSTLSNRNRTPSLTGQSPSPIISQPLRILTKNPSTSRLALATSHTNLSNTILSPDLTSPTDTMSPVSAIRTSIDKGFRLRSRSEADTAYRAEEIREARRKFAEKEQAKEEKVAREEIRALEKRQAKEARQIERGGRRSSASNHPAHGLGEKRSRSDTTMGEKDDVFVGRAYTATVPGDAPPMEEREYEIPRRSGTAKLKTHSAWTKFVMWIRTRFIRMSKKH